MLFYPISNERIKQRCVIDEAWQPLAPDSHSLAAAFILFGIRATRSLTESDTRQKEAEHFLEKKHRGENI